MALSGMNIAAMIFGTFVPPSVMWWRGRHIHECLLIWGLGLAGAAGAILALSHS